MTDPWLVDGTVFAQLGHDSAVRQRRRRSTVLDILRDILMDVLEDSLIDDLGCRSSLLWPACPSSGSHLFRPLRSPYRTHDQAVGAPQPHLTGLPIPMYANGALKDASTVHTLIVLRPARRKIHFHQWSTRLRSSVVETPGCFPASGTASVSG